MRLLVISSLFAAALLVAGACDRKVAGGSVDGAKIFSEVCARCHGPGGQPNSSMIARYGVKNLRTERVQRELTDADIRRQILNGSKNKQMPSFEGAITSAQLDAVIEHVRTFSTVPLDDSGRDSKDAPKSDSTDAPKSASESASESDDAAKSKNDAGASLGSQ